MSTNAGAAMPMTAILETRDLTMAYGGVRALAGVDLTVAAGTVHAIIGPNGAGKTTLFNLLSGLRRPTSGRIFLDGRDITGLPPYQLARRGLGRSFQISSVFPHMNVLDNLRVALAARTSVGYAFWLSERVLARFDPEAFEILEGVGLTPFAARAAASLGYGHRRALEIGLTLALRPAILLLDEPTAGLATEDIGRIVETVKRAAAGRTVVLVEHNMGVVAALAERITVFQRGRVLAEGTYEELRANPAVIEAYLGGAA